MAPKASIDRTIIRHDAIKKPVLHVTGVTDKAFLKLGDRFYTPVKSGSNTLEFPNRTMEGSFEILGVLTPDKPKKSAGLTGLGNGKFRGSGEGWKGVVHDDPLIYDQGIVHVGVDGHQSTTGLALLDSKKAVTYDYASEDVPHSMLFGVNGQGQIRERGRVVRTFRYLPNDIGVIEHAGPIVKFYLRHADGMLEQVGAASSQIEELPLGSAVAYSANATIDNLSVMESSNLVTVDSEFLSGGPMATGSTQGNITTVGVLKGFQDWFNDYTISSTADVLTMADNQAEFTYPSQKKRVRTLSANLARRDEADRWEYEAFFNYHGIEIEFIFVDWAKRDPNLSNGEWFAKFASPFGSKSRNQCLSAHTAIIQETTNWNSVPPQ